VQRVGEDAVVGPPPGGLDREEHVGGLRLRVGERRVVGAAFEVDVVEDDRGILVGPGADLPEVVRGELQLVSLRTDAPLRDGHHPGVVDQKVQRVGDRGDEPVDRPAVDQVEVGDRHGPVARGSAHVGGDALGRGRVARSDDRLGARRGERASGLDADPARRAGDERAAAVQIDALDDLEGGAGGAER